MKNQKLLYANAQVVSDVMTPKVIAVTAVTFLPEAARIMKDEDVGSLPVVEASGKLLGILTDRDIAVRAVAAGLAMAETQVQAIYTAGGMTTAFPDTLLADAEALMIQHQVRRLPIVSAENRLVGVVSLADITRAHSDATSGQVLREVSKPGGEHSQTNEALG